MARPRTRLLPEDYEELRKLLFTMVPQTEIARTLGVSYHVWMDLRENDARVKALVSEAREHYRDRLAGKLMQEALDGNTACLIFACKALAGINEQGPAEVRIQNGVVLLPTPQTRDQFMRLLEAPSAPVEGNQ